MLTFYVASNLSRANECVLDQIKVSRQNNRKVLILTPDRMNFRIQSYVFDVLKEKSLFDVEVNTLTRIVHKYLSNHGQEKTVLSKQAGIAIVKNILLSHKQDFTCFAKALHFDGFASVVYETICMLKACNVEPSCVAEKTSSPLLNQKLDELAFIYKKYEEFLSQDFSDSFNRLDLYEQLIKKEDFLDIDIYWIGFEDLTQKMLAILTKMARFTSVHIAVSYQKKENCQNYFLYHNAPYVAMLDFCTVQGIVSQTIWCKERDEDRAFLASHLFGISAEKYQAKKINFSILEANNPQDEVAFILRYIGLQVAKGNASYDDYALVLSQFSCYKDELIAQAKTCQIPLYLDESVSFIEHAYVRVIFDILSLLNENMDATLFVQLLKHPLFAIERQTLEKLENWIAYVGCKSISETSFDCINGEKDEDKVRHFYALFFTYQQRLNKETAFEQFIKLSKQLFNDLEYVTFLTQKQQQLLQQKEYELARSTAQLYQKFEQLWTELEKVLSSTSCDFDSYIRILRSVAYDMTISLPPVTHHSVKVYSLDKSELTPTKYMYFLGVNAGQFPPLLDDRGLVSDGEFAKVSYQKQVSPTIKQLNQRAKRKCLDALLLCDHTYLSYSTSNGVGGSLLSATIVDELISMLNLSVTKISPLLDLESIISSKDKTLFQMQNFSKYLTRNSFAQLTTSYSGDKEQLVSLSLLNDICEDRKYLSQYFDEYDRKNIDDAYALFYPKGTASVSQFERFYACPYQHFVQYGLRVKPNEDSLMTSREFGNILHLFCMKFVQDIRGKKLDQEQLVSRAHTNLSHILQLPEYARFSQDSTNYFLLQSLQSEVVRLAKALYNENNHSKFVPVVLEGSFGGDALLVRADEKEIKMKGKIDRVDEYQSMFRIVDYKTGADSFSYTDVASGKKLQLLIYVLAYANKSNKTPVSAVYLPIKNKFDKEEKQAYSFDGLIPDNHALLSAMDDRLDQASYTSDIIKASTNENGEIAKVHDLMLGKGDIKELCQFAYSMIEQAYKNSIHGQIAPNPLVVQNKRTCQYCSYLPMCKFSIMKGDKERIVETCDFQKLMGKEDMHEAN